MREAYTIWEQGEYDYEGAFGFVPNIHAYIHDDEKVRPALIIVPGGGYRVVAPTEGEIVAEKFREYGFQTFVMTYTTNLIDIAPLKKQPFRDLSRTVRYIRANARRFHVDPGKIFICGFSAGAHLTGTLAVHWQDDTETNAAYQAFSNRPDGVILSYPVITSGEYAHRDSFTALCGKDAANDELAYFSLEKQVSRRMPPVFLWQTVTDETVPVENSLLMAAALKKSGIPFEYHLFPNGVHGISLSNQTWETGNLGDPYTMDQTIRVIMEEEKGSFSVSKNRKEQLMNEKEQVKSDKPRIPSGKAVKEVAVWPDLAAAWIRSLG